eukprot:384863_1
MDSLVWKPNSAEIVIIIILFAIFAVVHFIYGIRFRCTKLSQSVTNWSMNEPLLTGVSKSTIKVLSQNIWCVFFKGGKHRRKRLKILLNNIKTDNPDIICLQEMHILGLGLLLLCGDYIYVQKHLIKQGYIYHTDPKLSVPIFGSSSGLVIFSKYPIINSISKTFEHRRPCRYKGYIYANISIPNLHNIKIINTHLEHRQFDMKFEQMREIINGINNRILDYNNNDIEQNNKTLLCVGDFNVCSNFTFGGNGYDLLCEFMGNVGLNIDLYSDTTRTYCKSKQRCGTKSFDHFFINDNAKKYVQKSQVVDYRNEERIMSDHLGLLTTFQF